MTGKRLDKGLCPICGRALLHSEGEGCKKLRDGAMICAKCVRRVRFMYPLSEAGGDFSDPMKDACLSDIREAMDRGTEPIEAMRERLGFPDAAFLIDSVEEKKGGLFKANTYLIRGRSLFGVFDPADRVRLGGAELELKSVTNRAFVVHDLFDRAEPGHPCILEVSAKSLDCKKGDTLVK